MPSDTVPVALNRDNLTPGIIYVKPKKHSYQIKQWTNNGIPIRTHSTTPFKVRELLQYKEFPTFVPEDFVDFSDGYRRFKRPNELYKPVSSLEGYSIEQFTVSEQFDKNKSKFNKYLKNKTLLEKEAIAAQTNRMMNNLCQSIYDRAKAINDGHNYFLKIKEEGRNCMNASEFDQYSTFSRDSRLTDSFLEFKNFIDSNDNLSGFNFRNKRLALDIFAKSFSDRKVEKEYFVNFCHIDYENDHFGYKSNHKIQLRNLWQRIQDGLLVQNPNTTADRRWGHYYGEFKTDCPTFEEIH
jgi:hypothetical protein